MSLEEDLRVGWSQWKVVTLTKVNLRDSTTKINFELNVFLQSIKYVQYIKETLTLEPRLHPDIFLCDTALSIPSFPCLLLFMVTPVSSPSMTMKESRRTVGPRRRWTLSVPWTTHSVCRTNRPISVPLGSLSYYRSYQEVPFGVVPSTLGFLNFERFFYFPRSIRDVFRRNFRKSSFNHFWVLRRYFGNDVSCLQKFSLGRLSTVWRLGVSLDISLNWSLWPGGSYCLSFLKGVVYVKQVTFHLF